MKDALALMTFLGATFSAAAIGAFFMPGPWYETLVKPGWTPPNWLFGPVWTLLYVMIGTSAWLVWREAGFSGARWALAAFALQIVLNAAWSWLFFGLQRLDLALVDISLLVTTIVLMVVLYAPISRFAAGLLLPYLAWVSFATALNAAIWKLNP
jgi:tryptophan-rich sensory protein